MKYTEGSVKNSDSMGWSKYVNYSLKKMLQGKLMYYVWVWLGVKW